jgi:glutathione S-transferase
VITVHHLNNSRSQRILWLLEELGLPYEVRRYQRDAQTMLAPPELRAVHPLGKSPVISDGEVTLAESGAIVEYLAARHGNGSLVPKAGTPEHVQYIYWLHFAEGSAMPPLLLKLIFDRIESGKGMAFFVKPFARGIAQQVQKMMVQPNLERQLEYMEKWLAGREWFAGANFSAADIQMSFPLEAAASRGGLTESRPKLWAFLKKIHGRPAYQRALEKGGKYELIR